MLVAQTEKGRLEMGHAFQHVHAHSFGGKRGAGFLELRKDVYGPKDFRFRRRNDTEERTMREPGVAPSITRATESIMGTFGAGGSVYSNAAYLPRVSLTPDTRKMVSLLKSLTEGKQGQGDTFGRRTRSS